MTAAKSSFLSTDLLRETRKLLSGEPDDNSVARKTTRLADVLAAAGENGTVTGKAAALGAAIAAFGAAAGTARQRERLYLRYGQPALAALEAAGAPLSDRQLFESVAAKVEAAGFDEFRVALQELVARGLIAAAGNDPTFGDPRYTVAPPAG